MHLPQRLLASVLVLIVAFCVTGVLGIYRLPFAGVRSLAATASAGFVLVAVTCGALYSRYGRLILMGLMCCCLGDILGPIHFKAGVGAFFLGHVFFIAAFITHGVSRRRIAYTLPVLVLATTAVMAWLYPHVPKGDTWAVIPYALALSGTVLFAGGASAGNRLALAAAIIFYISDIFVARWHFVTRSGENAFFCYPLYYTACLLFAFSVLGHGLSESATGPLIGKPSDSSS